MTDKQKLRNLVQQGLFNVNLFEIAKNLFKEGKLKETDKVKAILEVADEIAAGLVEVGADVIKIRYSSVCPQEPQPLANGLSEQGTY